MPRKIRELIGELESAGFIDRGGKGSHRNLEHPKASESRFRANWVMTLNDTKNVK